MPVKKINLKKVTAGTLLVGAPIGATLGVVYGTKDNTTERQEVPAVTFGDKYFDSTIKTNHAYAPSHVFSPDGGYNLYASFTDLSANNDTEHYLKLIKQKPESEGGGATAPIYSHDIDVTDITSVEDLDAKILEVNDRLHYTAEQTLKKRKNKFLDTNSRGNINAKDKAYDKAIDAYYDQEGQPTLGLLTIPTIKEGKRVIEVIAYELETNNGLTKASSEFFNAHLGIDTENYTKSLEAYIQRLSALAGKDGFNWDKKFLQAVLSKTIPDNNYFSSFGMDNSEAASGENQIHTYKLKYKINPKTHGKEPVKFTDGNGVEHFVLTRSSIADPTYVEIAPGDLIDGKLGTEEYLFDGRLLNANGDFDYESPFFLSHEMVKNQIIPQIEASLDWKENNWFAKMTFNKINSDSIVSLTSSLDSVRNPESILIKTIRVPLEILGKPQGYDEKLKSKISAANLLAYDEKVNKDLDARKTTNADGNIDIELQFEKNSMLRHAVTDKIKALGSDDKNLYELFRNTFLGEPGSNMAPQFSHYLKRNLISDGLNIIGQFMPGILAPINGFESLIKMIEEQKVSLVKYKGPDGKEYQGEDFLRNVIFSDDNIKAIFAKLDSDTGTTNGISFIYHSLIQFGVAEQRVPGIVSKGTTNENGEAYIVDSSEDWLWSSVTKLTGLSATDNYERYSLYNLYSLFAGLNIIDPCIIDSLEGYGIAKTSAADSGDSIVAQLFSWASDNNVLPKGYGLQDVLADIPGTIKKLLGNLYKNNVIAREDEAKGLPYKDRHAFVAFPSNVIEKLISLIPGVDWTEIKNKEIDGYKNTFDSLILSGSSQRNVRELSGSALEDFAKKEWGILNDISTEEAKNYPLPTYTPNSLDTGATKEKLYNFITGYIGKGYLQKFTLVQSFDLASEVRDMYKTYDPTVLKGYIIPNEIPDIDPQEDVRKAAVSIFSDPYTLISLIDSVKGDMDIDKFLDSLLPPGSININNMIPVLLKSLSSKHNLDILSIDKILNVVSRMNLLPSIVDKILTPSSISTISSLIESGDAKNIFDALTVVYGKGLYTYLKDPAGKNAFRTDLAPVINAFADKLKLITEAQKAALPASDKPTAVTTNEFADAIYDILQNGIGSAGNNISTSLQLIGNVVTNALELPSSMINVPKLVEALTDILENKSIQQVLSESLANTDPKNPTAFSYLFSMLHSDGSTIIYDMLPGALQTAMDTTSTNDLMQIFDHLINGFDNEDQFKQLLALVKGILPKDDDGKTLLDKKITEIDPDITSLASVVPKIETLLLNAFNDKELVSILGNKGGKAEVSDILSPILHSGLLSDPANVTKAVHDLLHAKVIVHGWFGIHLYTLDVWSLLPDSLKTTLTSVLDKLQGGLEVVNKLMSNPINTLSSDDIKKVIDIVKIFVPNLKVSDELVSGILFVAHNGLNVGAGTSTPMDALKEVNKLFAVIGSFTTIPDMVKNPVMNLLIGKTTFETYKDQVIDQMTTVVNDKNNQYIKYTLSANELPSIKDEINQYNILVNSLGTYKSMVKDLDSLKTVDVQTIVSYKAKADDIILKLKALKTKIDNGRTEQADALADMQKVSTEISDLEAKTVPDIVKSNPTMLAYEYQSLDGSTHKYVDFDSIDYALRVKMLGEAEALIKGDYKTIAELKTATKALVNIYNEVTRVDGLIVKFNDGVIKSKQIFDAYQKWLTDTNPGGGAYVAPHNTNPVYVSVMNIAKAKLEELKKSANVGNVSLVEDNIKAAYKAFNDKLAADKALAKDSEAINSLFSDLSAEQLKSIISGDATVFNNILASLTDDNFKLFFRGLDKADEKAFISKLSSTNKDRSMNLLGLNPDKVKSGLPGIDSATVQILEGKSVNWMLDNIKIGYHKYWRKYGTIDLFGQDETKNADSDVRGQQFAPLRNFKYQTSGIFSGTTTRTIKDFDGDGDSPDFVRMYVLKDGNNGYNKLSDSHHELLTLLQNVYDKNLNWLIDNGWI